MAVVVSNATQWSAQCIRNYGNRTSDLVDRFGQPTTNRSDAWGITLEACYEYCGPEKLSQAFSLATFAPAFTNFLLPWLALTAQLPYETSEWYMDLLSLALALGSPALSTFSLSVTILNRHWIRRQFQELHREAEAGGVSLQGHVRKLLGAQILLQEGQQAPLRISTADGSLNELFLQEENIQWWYHIGKDLIKARRGVTSSLVAQIVVAAIAWLFTIIISLGPDLGDIETALQLASGSVLVWMIPVICGWIVVGTQRYKNSVRETLEETAHSTTRTNWERPYVQRGIVMRTGLGEPAEIPRKLGIDITGDEGRQGPVWNFSRAFTWSQASLALIDGFRKSVDHQTTCQKSRVHRETPKMDSEIEMQVLSYTTAPSTTRECSPLPFEIPVNAYPRFSEIRSDVWWRLVIAALFAVLMQWGTTGAAVMIAYLTPAAGLGCRSGSYTIYGVTGTTVWVLHCISALLSHTAMTMYQDIQHESPDDCGEPNFSRPRLSLCHTMVCWLTVLTDILGKFLAVINALWIVTSNLLEYIGVYSTCWCEGEGDLLALGSSGWVLLFKSASDIADVAGGSWQGGIAMSLLVCFVSLVFFVLSLAGKARFPCLRLDGKKQAHHLCNTLLLSIQRAQSSSSDADACLIRTSLMRDQEYGAGRGMR
ncbi:hypothetical protein MMC13_000996 [Lambiella insularis]|nr:hypothetical protein [Lambiella insularis]